MPNLPNRYAISIEYRVSNRPRRLSFGAPDRDLTTIVEALEQLAAIVKTNVQVTRIEATSLRKEPRA